MDMHRVDHRSIEDLSRSERRKFNQVLKLLTAPATAKFLPGDFQTDQTSRGVTTMTGGYH